MSTISSGVSATSAAAMSAVPALPSLEKLVADAVKFYAAHGHFRGGDIDEIVSKLTQDGLVSDDDLTRLDAKLSTACVFGAADEATVRKLFSRVAGELEFRVGRGELDAEGGVATISGLLIDNSAFSDVFDAAALSKAAAFAADRFSAAGVRDATRAVAADGVYSESELEVIWNAASADRDVSLWDVRAMYKPLDALLKEGKLTDAQHATMCAQLDASLQARLAVDASRSMLSNQAREFVSGYLPVREGLAELSQAEANGLVSRLAFMGAPEGSAHGVLSGADLGALAATARNSRGEVDSERARKIGVALRAALAGGQITQANLDATVAELRSRGIDVSGAAQSTPTQGGTDPSAVNPGTVTPGTAEIPAPADLSTTTALADAAARATEAGGASAIAAYVQRAIQLAAGDNADGKLTQGELIEIRKIFGQSLANAANRITGTKERTAFFNNATDGVDVAIQGATALLNADAAAYAAKL